YIDDVTGNFQEAHGSDSRLNVSSRADNRAYYNSRDRGQCYTLVYDHPSAADNQYSFYLKNTSTTKALVVSSVGLNSDDVAIMELLYVTGSVVNGVSFTPTNLNKSSSNDADATALEDGGGTAISSVTDGAEIDSVTISAKAHEEMRLSDRLRLGQNDAVALKMITGTTTPDVSGVVFFYFE
ncbi:hypothetical protein LCGC14_1809440, partial [marine sediment metagenome]